MAQGVMQTRKRTTGRILLNTNKDRRVLPSNIGKTLSNKCRRVVQIESNDVPINVGYNVMQPIYDFKTTNESFLVVHEQLKKLGITNNAFHLILLNPLLQGVDPYSENLTNEQVCMIIQECKLNIFYYLREVVRIEEQGGGLVKFRMDRGSLASCYCFYNNINFYLMKPRQTGKTVCIVALLSWAMKFAGPNGDMMFSCYRPELTKKNLRAMKTILGNLPSYLSKMGTETVNNLGKTVRKTDNITVYREPAQNNSAMIAPPASTEDSADTVGRGYTQIYQFFDEAEFTKYIGTIVKVSGMAYNTAASNAEKNGSGHCRIFATTPGDLGNKKTCQSAMEIVNDAIVWDEKKFFDELTVPQFKALIESKSKFKVVYIEYDYLQLGLDERWFINACANVGGDVNKIKREILLMRFSGNSDSPFTEEEIEDISNNVQKPIAIKRFNKIYDVLFYDTPKKGRSYIIGLDPSDGTGSDNYAMTILDPYELKVVAEFRSPYMTIRGCVDLVTDIVQKYFPKSILVIERNRNGGAVVELFKESPLRHLIYSSPKANEDASRVSEQYDDLGFIKEQYMKNKYFGTNTTASSRQVMMNILLDFMHFARNLVTSQYLVEDIKNLVIRNDKIQAAAGEHDDSVMSWLIALYVYYYGEKLERFGFVKGELPSDVVEDDEFNEIAKLYSNPEIKRQFPTMYAYYLAEKKLHDAKINNKKEQMKEQFKPFDIGGLGDNIKEDDIPDIDRYLDNKKKETNGDGIVNKNTNSEPAIHVDINANTFNDTNDENWRRSVVRKFMSLNR